MEDSAQIMIIGAGGAGTNVVTRLSQYKLKDVECIALASKWPYELQKIPLARKMSLFDGLVPRKGFDGSPLKVESAPRIREMLAKELPELSSRLKLVIIVAGLGGLGGFVSHIVARLAREAGNLVIGVVTTPFDFEGKERHRYATEELAMLVGEANSVITISGDAYRYIEAGSHSSNGRLGVSEFFRTMDALLCDVIEAVIVPMIEPRPPQKFLLSWGCIDYPKDTWSEAGRALVGIGYAKGKESPIEALKSALACPSLEGVLGRATKAYAVIRTNPDLRLSDIEEALTLLSGAVDRSVYVPYQVVVGALMDPTLSSTAKSILIMSAPSEKR